MLERPSSDVDSHTPTTDPGPEIHKGHVKGHAFGEGNQLNVVYIKSRRTTKLLFTESLLEKPRIGQWAYHY